MRDRRSTCCGLCLPATVHLQGLATLLAAFALRSRAGFVSHRQHSWDSTLRSFPLPKGIRRVSARKHPLTVLPAVSPAAEATGRPGRPRFLGFYPFESPSRSDRCLICRPPAAPLGFCPSRVFEQGPRPGFRPVSSHALRGSGEQARRRPRVSIGTCPAPCAPRSELPTAHAATLLGFPHRRDPRHSDRAPPGLCVHLTPRRASLPTARRSWGSNLALPESLGPLKVPSAVPGL
jgi:hypothetical protein